MYCRTTQIKFSENEGCSEIPLASQRYRWLRAVTGAIVAAMISSELAALLPIAIRAGVN